MENKLYGVLRLIAEQFNRNGIHYGIGGSVMLRECGFDTDCNDIDIFVTLSDSEAAQRLLEQYGKPLADRKSDLRYDTKRFMQYDIEGVGIDLIAGFRTRMNGQWYDLTFDENTPTFVKKGIHYMPVEDWYVLYRLIERKDKFEMIRPYLIQFADKGRIMELLKLRLPLEIKEELKQIMAMRK